MTGTHQLGELQLAIMKVLWQRKEGTVGEVHAALHEERGLALTTISTMLVKMEQKGVVGHRSEGRRFIYYPLISEGDVRRTMVGELTERLFQGDVTALVSHLISHHDVDGDELSRLKNLIAEHEKQEAKQNKGGRR